MHKQNTIEYFLFIPHHFPRELFYGGIPGLASGGNVRRGMKYPEGNVPDLSCRQTDRLKCWSCHLMS